MHCWSAVQGVRCTQQCHLKMSGDNIQADREKSTRRIHDRPRSSLVSRRMRPGHQAQKWPFPFSITAVDSHIYAVRPEIISPLSPSFPHLGCFGRLLSVHTRTCSEPFSIIYLGTFTQLAPPPPITDSFNTIQFFCKPTTVIRVKFYYNNNAL